MKDQEKSKYAPVQIRQVLGFGDFDGVVEQLAMLRELVSKTETCGKRFAAVSDSLIVPQIKQTP